MHYVSSIYYLLDNVKNILELNKLKVELKTNNENKIIKNRYN